MSYKYNPYRDTFTHIDDEEPITVTGAGTALNVSATPVYSYPVVYLVDECIERIAEAVVRKMNEVKRDER